MRWRGLLKPAFHPRLKQRCTTYTKDHLYLCTCHFAIRFAHRSHMDRLYPYLTPDIFGSTSRLVIGIITTTHESVPCSPFSFLVPLLYLLAPSNRFRTKPVELSVMRPRYSLFLILSPL